MFGVEVEKEAGRRFCGGDLCRLRILSTPTTSLPPRLCSFPTSPPPRPTTWVECPPRDTQPFSQVIFLSVIGLYFYFLHGRPLATSLHKGSRKVLNLSEGIQQWQWQNYEKKRTFGRKRVKPHFLPKNAWNRILLGICNSETKYRTGLPLTSKLLQRGIQMPCLKKHVWTEKNRVIQPNIWECAETK